VTTSPWLFPALFALLLPFAVRMIASCLNLLALDAALPPDCADIYDNAKYAESQRYAQASMRLDMIESTVQVVLLLAFWIGGGFGWLDHFVRSWHFGEIGSGLPGLGLLYAATAIVSLPWSIYNTFVLEARHGFNKTTPATFISDRIKGLALAILIGGPVASLLLWFYSTVPYAWLWSWLAIAVISLVATFLAPRWLFPLFNKFTPLPPGELRDAIERLAETCAFPFRDISVVDGSKRSTKANAFFAGFGKTKRIALFDTLIEKHTVPELVAVLAHEIGHFKRHHIWQMTTLGLVQTGILLFVLGLVIDNPSLFQAFGVSTPSVWLGFVFFSIIYQPIGLAVSATLAALSRRNEFDADAFAAQAIDSPRPLMDALKKLSRDHLANLTPHPVYVGLHYSHPPLRQRLAALVRHSPAANAGR
jgi:STE24 endopeptidase